MPPDDITVDLYPKLLIFLLREQTIFSTPPLLTGNKMNYMHYIEILDLKILLRLILIISRFGFLDKKLIELFSTNILQNFENLSFFLIAFNGIIYTFALP